MNKAIYILITFFLYLPTLTPSNISKNFNQREIKKSPSNFESGNEYYKNHLHSEAIKHFIKALEEVKDDTIIIKIKNTIAEIYIELKNFSLAENYVRESLSLSKQKKYNYGVANAYLILGHIKEKQGLYLKAIEHLDKSLKKFTIIVNDYGIAKSNIHLGSIYEDLHQFEKAHIYFLNAYKFLKNTNTIDECDVLNNIGDIFRKKGDFLKSLKYTKLSLLLAQKLDNSNLLESAYKDLSKSHYSLEKYKTAYNYRLKSESFKELTLKKRNTDQLNFLQTRYNSQKKQAEINLLKEKNKVSYTSQKLLILALIGLVSYILIASYFFSKKRKAKQKIQQYKERVLKAELDKKHILQTTLERDIEIKTSTLSKYSLHLSQKNKMLFEISKTLKNIINRENITYKNNLSELIKEINFSLKQDNEWEDFNFLFNDIHPDFSTKLINISNEKLSPAELKLSMLLRLNLSSKEIASILRVTPDSIRVARYRLRKKLPIESRQELVNFMITL